MREQAGELSLLNVGTGDTKISFGDNASEQEKKVAASLVKDMLRRGYAVLVEVGTDDKGPLYRRATDFDENTHEYLVVGLPEDEVQTPQKEDVKYAAGRTPGGAKRARGRGRVKRVSAKSAKAVAVGRTAGG